MGMMDCFDDGTWQILEPIMKVEVSGPDEFQGGCVGMLTKRSGLIVGVESNDGWFTAVSENPLNQMFGFSNELRSSTQGKGEYTMEYSRYAPCEPHIQDEIVEAYKASKEQPTDDKAGKKK